MPTTTRRPSPGAGSSLKSTDRVAADEICVRARLNAALLGVWLIAGFGAVASAQPAPASPQPPSAGTTQVPALPSAPAAVTVEPSAQAATLVFFNRPIVTLKATVLGRRPSDRTGAAVKALDEVVESGVISPVDVSPFEGGVLLRVGPRAVFGLTALDVDQLSGESLDGVAQQTVTPLRPARDAARR